jgi:response regulator of citrate/malate metabolism
MFLPESQGHSVCFFCRSDDHDALEGYFRAHPFKGLVKIISITQVRKSYNAYKDRKTLMKDHTHFVCDARVMTQLYNLLGKVFAERNNLPVPIEFETFSKIPAALQVSILFLMKSFL